MIRLNSETITQLCKYLSATGSCSPVAIENRGERIVVVTNASMLLEWPFDLVDRKCQEYIDLLKAQKDPSTTNVVAKISGKHWAEVLFGKKGAKFIPATEQDPTEDEVAEMQKREAKNPKRKRDRFQIFTTEKAVIRYRYNWAYIEAAEYAVDNPTFKMFRMPKDPQYSDALQMMAIYEGKGMIGAVANALE
jgi:hypothetical protein